MFQRGSSCTMSAAADAVSLGSETSRRARPSLATLEHRREGGGLAYAKSGGPRRQLRLLLEMASYPAREPAVVRRLDCIRRRNTGSAHEGGPGGWPYQRRLKRPPLISCGSHCRGGAGGGGSRRATRRAGLVAGGCSCAATWCALGGVCLVPSVSLLGITEAWTRMDRTSPENTVVLY